LDSITIQVSGSADANDINGFELYADLDQNGTISPVTDSLLASSPFDPTLIFSNITYGFEDIGVDLIITADVNSSADQNHILNLELQDPTDVVAYFDVNPFIDNFPFQVSDISLPVQLTSFNVVPYSDQVIIEWQTASEIDAHYYEIVKTYLSEEIVIDRIEASGNTSEKRKYSILDRNVDSGQTFIYSL